MSYLANPNSSTSGPFSTDAASHNTGFFSDNTNPSSVNCNVLPAPSSNVIAASGKWTGGKKRYRTKHRRKIGPMPKPGRSWQHRRKSEKRSIRAKQKRALASLCKCNICTKHRNKSKKCKKCKKRTKKHKHKRRTKRKSRRRRGGTTNNVPNTPSYSTGTELPYGLSALANPAPYMKLDNCTDNYNHYTGGKKRRGTKRRGTKRRGTKRKGG